ncbi:MAG: ABC transporter permease, partial [Nitrospirota bacterium]|nr:ABC transporter permease [Nitrospirota bacterium]
MRVLIYSLQTAFKSLWHEKWVNILTILSISISLLIISAFAAITLNADSVLKSWSKSFGLVVYLNEDLSTDEENALRAFFEKDRDIVEVKYISRDRAAEELHQIMGADAGLIDELQNNPLPASFELKLRPELLEPSIVMHKAAEIKQTQGVEDVQYGEKWLSSLSTVTNIMKISATFLGIAIFIAVVFITYNTIRILFYRRNEEIETLKLLGATKGSIRLPFLIEGAFIGVTSGVIS